MSWPEEVRRAVVADHAEPDACPNTCDIAAALRAGFPHVAAYLLQGATETPELDKVEIDYRPGGWPVGWSGWTAWHDAHAVECIACGAFAYPSDNQNAARNRPDRCGNCWEPLPVVTVWLEDGPKVMTPQGEDEYGNRWRRFTWDALALEHEPECHNCGRPFSEGWLCLDGGDELCRECVEDREPVTTESED